MTVEPPSLDIKFDVRGKLGVVTLDRPKALNALNLAMVEALGETLDRWIDDPAIETVVIKSASPRAFCAGGDMRSIGVIPDRASRIALSSAFFGAEYRVNHRIHTFPKPVVSLLNGIVMGGGLGISVHGTFRVVSEDVRMALPEVMLGLFPDIGSTWFLARCPGAIGRYLALTGLALGAADALTARLATHHVPNDVFDDIVSELASTEHLSAVAVEGILDAHATEPSAGLLAEREPDIARLFGGPSLEAVIAAIDAEAADTPWIAEVQSALRRACPTSLRATWRRLATGGDHSIERILSDDFRMGVRMVGYPDFVEGVRAVLVDKDGTPRWRPQTLHATSEARVDGLLAPLGIKEELRLG